MKGRYYFRDRLEVTFELRPEWNREGGHGEIQEESFLKGIEKIDPEEDHPRQDRDWSRVSKVNKKW